MTNPVEFVNVLSIKQEKEDTEIESSDFNVLSDLNFNENSETIPDEAQDKLSSVELTFKQESCDTYLQEGEFVVDACVKAEEEVVEKPAPDNIGAHFLLPILTPSSTETNSPVSTTYKKQIYKDSKYPSHDRSRGTLYQRFSCSICHTPYSSKRGLATHVLNTHKKTGTFQYLEKFDPSSSSSTNTSDNFQTLTKVFKIITPSKIEVKDPKNSTFVHQYNQCPKCSARFFSTQSLKSHFSSVHGNLNSKMIIVPSKELPPLKITHPIKKFTNEGIKINETYYQCTYCTSRFLNENSLKRHVSNIHGEAFT